MAAVQVPDDSCRLRNVYRRWMPVDLTTIRNCLVGSGLIASFTAIGAYTGNPLAACLTLLGFITLTACRSRPQ